MTTCSGLTSRLAIDVGGTASTISSFLLLEHSGPWGEDTREQVFLAGLGAARYARLHALWEGVGLRPLLIRRPDREGRRPDAPRLLIGSVTAGWLERLPAAALSTLDLDAVAAGRPGHGTPVV